MIHPSPACCFLVKAVLRSPSNVSPPKRAGGRTAVTVATTPFDRWERLQGAGVEILNLRELGRWRVDHEIRASRSIVEGIVLDHIALITKRDHELPVSMVTADFHDPA